MVRHVRRGAVGLHRIVALCARRRSLSKVASKLRTEHERMHARYDNVSSAGGRTGGVRTARPRADQCGRYGDHTADQAV